MRRNIKRSLPPLDVISFSDSSSAPSKRRMQLTTPNVGEEIEKLENENNEESAEIPSLASVSFELPFPNESESDVDDSDGEQERQTDNSYMRKQRQSAKHWSEIKNDMVRAVIESECIPDNQLCTRCTENTAVYRCLKCGAGVFYCEPCVTAVHNNVCIFHVVEEWKDGMFLPSPIVGSILNPRPWHSCPSTEIKTITAISESGVRHQLGVVACKCEPFPVSLARLRLWPTSSKQPTYALSFDLLDWMETMLLECQVSLNDFCKALNNKLPKYVVKKKIYPFIIDCFEEYRYLKHELRTLQKICPEKDYGNVCPACPVNDGTLIESFDALFGLPRKKTAGSSVRKPLHGNNVFYDQDDVDNFIHTYARPQSSQKDCNDFKAGDILRSKTQYKALDETAVFGRACRHGFPKQFLNLKHGERIGYAVWLIKDIIGRNEGKNIRLKIMYDIGCLLAKHLQASGQMNLLENVTLAVPAFHIYGHKASCQLQYSPRRVPGFGLTDGEQLERLWSYLRRFGRMTKEMRPSHRIDVLSDAILHYARNCKDTLVLRLIKNWKRATECISASTESISQLTSKSPVRLTESVIEELAEKERQLVCGEQTGPGIVQSTLQDSANAWTSVYMDKLRIYYSLRNNLCADGSFEPEVITGVVKKITSLDKELTTFEKENTILLRWTPNDEIYKLELQKQILGKCQELLARMKTVCRERLFLLQLKEKYAEGHALSKKLSKQVKNSDKKLRETLLEYNSSRDLLSEENKCSVKELGINDVRNHGTFNLDDSESDTSCIPHSIRRHAIDMLHLLRRSKEEKEILKEEMIRVFQYYEREEADVSERINLLSSNDNKDSFTTGSLALLKSEQQILQHRLLSVHNSLQSCVEMPDINFTSRPLNNNEEDELPYESFDDEMSTDASDDEME